MLIQINRGKNIIIFGVTNISFVHIDGGSSNVLVPGVGLMQGLDNATTKS